jgi:hypothetical protein
MQFRRADRLDHESPFNSLKTCMKHANNVVGYSVVEGQQSWYGTKI